MDLTITSVISLVIWGNLAILVLSVLFSSSKVFNSMNCNCMLFLLVITLLRFLCPFEFISISVPILSQKLLPPVSDFLRLTSVSFAGKEFYVYEFLLFVWITVSLTLLIKLLYQYMRFKSKLKLLVSNSKCLEVYDITSPISEEKIRIYKSAYISGPIISGVVHPVILLPDFSYSKKELQLILQHEIQHYHLKDVLFKVVTELFCIFYWWNPLIYVLKKKLFFLLEIRADSLVCKSFSDTERLEYLQCLKVFYQYKTTFYRFSLGFSGFRIQNSLVRRAKYLVENKHEKKTMFFSSGIIILMLIISIFYIFEPYAPLPSEIAETTFTLSQNNYIIQTEDNSYEMYDNDSFLGTVNDPYSDFLKELPIYYINKKGKVIRE